jgi:uncharacterized protein
LTQFQKVSEFVLDKLKKELPLHLSYHNFDHTIDVLQAVENISEQEGIGDNDKRLLLTAALFHDLGFLEGREGHEEESCTFARSYLPAYQYQPMEIEAICGMIMATRIPQSPRTCLDKILCDADLDYLGRDDFFMLSNKLFTELQAEGLIKDEEEWNREQADFMEEHRYKTETSIRLRQPAKEQYIELIKAKI